MPEGEALRARDFAEIDDLEQITQLIELEKKEQLGHPTPMHAETLAALQERAEELRRSQQN